MLQETATQNSAKRGRNASYSGSIGHETSARTPFADITNAPSRSTSIRPVKKRSLSKDGRLTPGKYTLHNSILLSHSNQNQYQQKISQVNPVNLHSTLFQDIDLDDAEVNATVEVLCTTNAEHSDIPSNSGIEIAMNDVNQVVDCDDQEDLADTAGSGNIFSEYKNHGHPRCICRKCGAMMW